MNGVILFYITKKSYYLIIFFDFAKEYLLYLYFIKKKTKQKIFLFITIKIIYEYIFHTLWNKKNYN